MDHRTKDHWTDQAPRPKDQGLRLRKMVAASVPAPDRVAVREFRPDERTGGRAVLHRVEPDRDFIAGLERRAAPALARQRIGTAALETPLLADPVLLRDDLDPDVRVRPLQF